MLKIGRYEIKFGWYWWIQTLVPTTIRCFLGFIWIFKEAISTDVDKKQQFPIGTPLMQEGRTYRYWKAPRDVKKGQLVVKS